MFTAGRGKDGPSGSGSGSTVFLGSGKDDYDYAHDNDNEKTHSGLSFPGLTRESSAHCQRFNPNFPDARPRSCVAIR